MLVTRDIGGRQIRFAVLIPSRGRGDILHKTFARMPFLNNDSVLIGTEPREDDAYRWLDDTACVRVRYANPDGSVGVAREKLRWQAICLHTYDYLVMTDDNARFTEASLHALVGATASAERFYDHTVFMAGMHGTAPHFDRGAIAKSRTTIQGYNCGYQLYSGVGAIFHCVNIDWMRTYQYPADCFALEDRHLFMTGIRRGDTDFRICMDAPFTKTRYQEGGQGDIQKRAWNCGRSIERLAHDFPEYVGAKGTFPTPWQFIISMANGATPDRLVGGAMRKGAVLVQTGQRKPLTARRVKRR